MASQDTIRVQGLAELNRAFARADKRSGSRRTRLSRAAEPVRGPTRNG